jgi:hypothetical protein
VKYWIFLFILPTLALADSNSLNLQIPSGPQSYQSDGIRTPEGLDCKNAIGGGTNVEFGVTGIVNNAVGPFGDEDPLNPQTKDLGLYARIVIPLDAPKERINCNTLYQLELQKKRLEVMRLKEELYNLQRLNNSRQFAN